MSTKMFINKQKQTRMQRHYFELLLFKFQKVTLAIIFHNVVIVVFHNDLKDLMFRAHT